MPSTDDHPAWLRAEVFTAGGTSRGVDQVSVNYDSIGPTISAAGTFIADDDFEDVGRVPKLCVEAGEAVASIDVNVRPVGGVGWIAASLEASNALSQPTPFGGYSYCWEEVTLPGTDGAADGYDYEIVAYDEHGNPSGPFQSQVTCQVPEKFVAPEGQRVAMTVDNQNVAHVVYTTTNAVRYLRWSQDSPVGAPDQSSWQPVGPRFPQQPNHNVWGEPVWCLYGWEYHGMHNDRPIYDCRDRLPGEEEAERQWGANVDIVIAPDGQPAVCFVAGPRVTSESPSSWLGDEYGTVAVLQRPAAPPSPQVLPWTWSPVYSEEARYFNCALATGVPVPRPPTSNGPPLPGLGVMFTVPTLTTGTSRSAPAFSLIYPTHSGGYVIVDDESAGLDVAMAVAPNGEIHAVYVDRYPTQYGPAALHHAFAGSISDWSTEVVQAFTPEWQTFARLPSLTVDAGGQVHISYSVLNELMNVVDTRWLWYVTGTGVPGVWSSPERVDGDLPGIESASGEPFLEGIASRVVMGRDAADIQRPQVAYFSRMRYRSDVEYVRNPEAAHTDIAQLLLAFNENDPQNPGWHSHTLASRVDQSAGLAAATSPAGRRRVAYHNGLANQLFYEQEESGNLAFTGTHYLPLPVGCAAKTRDPAGGGRPRFVATLDDPVPGDLMNLPVARTRPRYTDEKQLFRDLRAYGYEWINSVPKPPGAETFDWRTIDETDPPKWELIEAEGRPTGHVYMGDLLVFANELLQELNAAECPAGADPSLGGCWRAALGPLWSDFYSYVRAPDVAQGSIIEAAFRNVRLRSGSIPKLETKGVCLPDPGVSCDLVDSQREQRAATLPVPAFNLAGKAFAYDPGRPLGDQIAECAALMGTYGDARLIIGNGATVGTLGDGCYVCWPPALAPEFSALWLGIPPDGFQPFCGPPTCPNGGSRVGQERTHLVCRASGCELLGCVEACQQPPGSEAYEGDEQYVDHDATGTCTRCPPGRTPARCTGGDQVPPLGAGIGGAQCQWDQYGPNSQWALHWHARITCTAHADCDGHSGFTCQSGFCRSADGQAYQGAAAPLCLPYGCQECYRNLYCVTGPELLCLDPPLGANATCTTCPFNHTCAAEALEDPAVAAPLCFGRPFLDDFRVHAATQYASGNEIRDLTRGLLDMFSAVRFPTQAGGYDISIDERLEGAGFRFGGGAFNQGYLEFTLRFQGDFNIDAACDVDVPAPVILRVRLQPYFAADELDRAEPPHYRGATRWRMTHAHLIRDLVTGERAEAVSSCAEAQSGANQALTSMEQTFFDSAQANMGSGIEALWRRLTEDMVIGGWLFGRENAIRALDPGRDSIHITGSADQGDGDPMDTIEAVRLHAPEPDPASPQGGTAVLWYRER